MRYIRGTLVTINISVFGSVKHISNEVKGWVVLKLQPRSSVM